MADGARQGPRTSWARTRCSPTPTSTHVEEALQRPRLPRRAGHLPHRDGQRWPTWSCRRRASPRRTAPSPTPSAGCSACARPSSRPGEARADWEIIVDARQPARRDAGLELRRAARDHGRDRRPDAVVRRHQLRRASTHEAASAGPARRRPPRHADPAHRPVHARQGQVLPGRLPAPGGGGRRRVPAHADHRPHARALPHGHDDAALGRSQRAGARPASSRSTRTTPRASASPTAPRSRSRRGAAASRCRPASPTGCAGTVFVPFHFWESPANRLTNAALDPVAKIPEFKVCACRLASVPA